MLGVVFSCLILASFAAAAAGGNLSLLSDAALDGAVRAVTLILSLCGMLSLFSGVMAVFSEAGLLRRFARLLRPLLRVLFPGVAETGEGLAEISAAFAANLLGMGNVATPFALAAMRKMAATSAPGTASDDMVTFSVLSTVPVTVLPTTMIALRRLAGSAHAAVILPPVALVSLLSSLFALLVCRLLCRLFPGRKEKREKGGGAHA